MSNFSKKEERQRVSLVRENFKFSQKEETQCVIFVTFSQIEEFQCEI